MKKAIFKIILAPAAILALQAGCNAPEQKPDAVKPPEIVNYRDTLKIYLQVRKMEMKAYNYMQARSYDSALLQYQKCISVLNTALEQGNRRGLTLYAGEIIESNESMEPIYDYLNQPENSINCTRECLKWAKLSGTVSLQITSNIKIANKLKVMAENITTDTAKKGSLCRLALQYALAGARVIDSLKTNDMDDLRYDAFHSISKIYAVSGNKKQAELYDKKYKEVYFNIYKRQPDDK